MRLYALPSRPRGILFDVDRTLYDNDSYAQGQIDLLVQRLASHRGEPLGETRRLIARERERSGSETSLGNIFVELGVPIEQSVAWRNELIRPEAHLGADPSLEAALEELAAVFRLGVVTNNPEGVGRASLSALGVERYVAFVVGLDTTGASKPDPAPFREAARRSGLAPSCLISVGDRYAVDIAPALALGMGGILVNGVTDVYGLPDLLLRRAAHAVEGVSS